MIKSIIIEDETKTKESLEYLINKYCPEVTVCASAGSFTEGYELYKQKLPDLLFLDIQLNSQEGSGIDLAAMKELANCPVIFISGYKDYAVEAFRLNAVDYLLKPIKINQLQEAVVKAKLFIQEQKKHLEKRIESNTTFHIPTQHGFVILKQQDIIRCEADGSYTHFYLSQKKEKFTASINIGQVETKLGPNFMRVHKSHIINKDHVLSYSKNEGLIVTLIDQSEVPVSRALKDDFFKWLG
jgi:two-component system, LytTR family, response regulator